MRSRYEDDDGEVLRDGESVRVPLTLQDAMARRQFTAFDATAHQPHHGVLTDEQREQRNSAYANYKRTLSNNWRTPSNPTPHAASPDDIELAERVASILGLAPPLTATSAPPYTDSSSMADNRKLAKDAQAVRDAAYDAYVRNLTSNWKTR